MTELRSSLFFCVTVVVPRFRRSDTFTRAESKSEHLEILGTERGRNCYFHDSGVPFPNREEIDQSSNNRRPPPPPLPFQPSLLSLGIA